MSLDIPCPVLQQIVASGEVLGTTGATKLNSAILPGYAEALFRFVKEHNPTTALEVGMAYGVSSLAILTGLSVAGNEGRLISIDPVQSRDWNSGGITSVRRAGFADRHRMIEKPDYLALPELVAEGAKLDFAYIDGWHTFDYTLLDFFFVDKMLKVGGVVAFNDCNMEAVAKTIEFLKNHRRYREIEVGFASVAPKPSLIRRLLGRDTKFADRYFRKQEDWEPDWNFYRSF